MKKSKTKNGWTPESIAKMVATRAANKAAKLAGGGAAVPVEARTKDALAYLTTARNAYSVNYKNTLIDLAIYTLRGVK